MRGRAEGKAHRAVLKSGSVRARGESTVHRAAHKNGFVAPGQRLQLIHQTVICRDQMHCSVPAEIGRLGNTTNAYRTETNAYRDEYLLGIKAYRTQRPAVDTM